MTDIFQQSYSERVLSSGIFELLERYPIKSKALEKSLLNKSTFYDYSKLAPIKNLLCGERFSRSQCFDFLAIYEKISKEYSVEVINQIFLDISLSDNFEQDFISRADKILSVKSKVNDIFSQFYESINIRGSLLPISDKGSSQIPTHVQLLAFSIWSISTSDSKHLSEIISLFPKGLYLENINNRTLLLNKLAANLFKKIPKEILLQSSEILITTRTNYRDFVLDVLQNGWVNCE